MGGPLRVTRAPVPYLNLLLADARLPTGAHASSAGLEAALRHGLSLSAVPDYILARLRTVTEIEAAAAVVARAVRLTAAGSCSAGGHTVDLGAVEDAWRARTPSRAARDAALALGRGYRRLAESLWPLGLDPAAAYSRPVVLGVTAAVVGLSAQEVARVVGYEDVQSVLAAALKLAPFDPVDAARWAVEAGAEVEQMADRVAGLNRPADIPAHGAPQLELWLSWHSTDDRRLYRA